MLAFSSAPDHAGRCALAIALMFLAGCIPYGSSDAIKVMPADVAKGSFISDIEVKSLPTDVSPEFKPKLIAALQAEMAKCAKGAHPLKLAVSIDRFSGQNAAMTVLVGSSNSIKGTAQLIAPDTNTVIGDYDIERSVGGGGLIAAIGMSGAESQTAHSFGAEICNQAFKGN